MFRVSNLTLTIVIQIAQKIKSFGRIIPNVKKIIYIYRAFLSLWQRDDLSNME